MMKRVLFGLIILLGTGLVRAQDNISLISPYDEDTLETKNPLLTWAYLGDLDRGAIYRLILVELNEDQSAEAGIIVNQPILKMDDIQGTQLFYPYDAPELEEGKWYAWQIQEVVNNVIIDKSEAWKFYIPLPPVVKPIYHRLKSKPDGTIYSAVNGKFYFYLQNRYRDEDLKFYVYDDKGEMMSENIVLFPEEDDADQEINVRKTGMNYYLLDLGEFAQEGVYRLIIIDPKKQRYETNFEVR